MGYVFGFLHLGHFQYLTKVLHDISLIWNLKSNIGSWIYLLVRTPNCVKIGNGMEVSAFSKDIIFALPDLKILGVATEVSIKRDSRQDAEYQELSSSPVRTHNT